MAQINVFEDLEVWKDARVLVRDIYDQTRKIHDYGFCEQIQRAAVSIMNNLSEGFERNKLSKENKQFVNFLNISNGSCSEVKSMLYLAEDLGYIDPSICQELREKCTKISNKIYSLSAYLSNTPHPPVYNKPAN